MTNSNSVSIISMLQGVHAKHALANHRIFSYLFNPDISKESIFWFASQFLFFSAAFPRLLEKLIEKSPSAEISRVIYKNLLEEFGSGNPEHSHLNIYKQFLYSIDFPWNETQFSQPLPKTVALIDQLQHESSNKFFVGFGAVALGAECCARYFYDSLICNFPNIKCIENADLTAIRIHAVDDTRHANDIVAIFREFDITNSNASHVVHGIYLSHVLFHNFWENIGAMSGYFQPEYIATHNNPSIETNWWLQ